MNKKGKQNDNIITPLMFFQFYSESDLILNQRNTCLYIIMILQNVALYSFFLFSINCTFNFFKLKFGYQKNMNKRLVIFP